MNCILHVMLNVPVIAVFLCLAHGSTIELNQHSLVNTVMHCSVDVSENLVTIVGADNCTGYGEQALFNLSRGINKLVFHGKLYIDCGFCSFSVIQNHPCMVLGTAHEGCHKGTLWFLIVMAVSTVLSLGTAVLTLATLYRIWSLRGDPSVSDLSFNGWNVAFEKLVIKPVEGSTPQGSRGLKRVACTRKLVRTNMARVMMFMILCRDVTLVSGHYSASAHLSEGDCIHAAGNKVCLERSEVIYPLKMLYQTGPWTGDQVSDWHCNYDYCDAYGPCDSVPPDGILLNETGVVKSGTQEVRHFYVWHCMRPTVGCFLGKYGCWVWKDKIALDTSLDHLVFEIEQPSYNNLIIKDNQDDGTIVTTDFVSVPNFSGHKALVMSVNGMKLVNQYSKLGFPELGKVGDLQLVRGKLYYVDRLTNCLFSERAGPKCGIARSGLLPQLAVANPIPGSLDNMDIDMVEGKLRVRVSGGTMITINSPKPFNITTRQNSCRVKRVSLWGSEEVGAGYKYIVEMESLELDEYFTFKDHCLTQDYVLSCKRLIHYLPVTDPGLCLSNSWNASRIVPNPENFNYLTRQSLGTYATGPIGGSATINSLKTLEEWGAHLSGGFLVLALASVLALRLILK